MHFTIPYTPLSSTLDERTKFLLPDNPTAPTNTSAHLAQPILMTGRPQSSEQESKIEGSITRSQAEQILSQIPASPRYIHVLVPSQGSSPERLHVFEDPDDDIYADSDDDLYSFE